LEPLPPVVGRRICVVLVLAVEAIARTCRTEL